MRIKRMYIEGAYSFPTLDFDFTDHSGGVTIILGKNLDQKTNNGAGKSTILKCLYLLAYGKDLNGANIDDAISLNSPKGGFSGFLEFEDKGSNFKITRYRKAAPREDGIKLHDGKPVSGNGIEFMMDDMCLNGESDPQTQKIIENKLRISPRLFLSSVLMAQNSRENFLEATDVKKKELLSELLDLTEYGKAFENIKKEIKNTENRLALIEQTIDNINENIITQTKRVEQLKIDEKNWVEENKLELESLKNKKEAEEAKILELKNQLEAITESDKIQELKSNIEKIEAYIDKQEKKAVQESQIIIEKNKAETSIQTLKESIVEKNTRIEKYQKEILDLKNVSTEKLEILDISKEEGKLQELNESIKEYKIETSSDVLRSIKETLENKTITLQKNIEDIKSDLEKTLSDSNCPTCKKAFEEGDVHFEEIKNDFNKKIAAKESELSSVQEEITQKTLELEKTLDKEKTLKEKENLISKLEKTILETKNKNEKNSILINQQNQAKEKISQLEEEIKKIEKDKIENNTKIESNNTKISKYKELLDKIEEIKNNIKLAKEKLLEKTNEFSQIEKASILMDQLKKELEERNNRVLEISKTLTSKKESGNPYKKIKDQIISDLMTQKSVFKEKKESADQIQKDLKYLQFWKKGFAPTGIRSFISDDIIDILNMKTQQNLNYLFDGALTVLFDPETSSKKGSTSNKISTKFFLNGAETKWQLISGGEQQRCILAVDLALTEIAESRSGIKLNLKFLDEPFNGIDANGQQKSLALFSKLAQKKDGFYIISHEEKFQNMCQNQIYILKKNGVSQIVSREDYESVNFNDEDADVFYQKQEAAANEKSKRGRKKKFKSIDSLDRDEE